MKKFDFKLLLDARLGADSASSGGPPPAVTLSASQGDEVQSAHAQLTDPVVLGQCPLTARRHQCLSLADPLALPGAALKTRLIFIN